MMPLNRPDKIVLSVLSLSLCLSIILALAGCAAPRPGERWPIDRMLDPVTDEVPNVRTR